QDVGVKSSRDVVSGDSEEDARTLYEVLSNFCKVIEGVNQNVAKKEVEYDDGELLKYLSEQDSASSSSSSVPVQDTFGYLISASYGIDQAVSTIAYIVESNNNKVQSVNNNTVTTIEDTNVNYIESLSATYPGGLTALHALLHSTKQGRDALRHLARSLLRVRSVDDDGKVTMDAIGWRIYMGIGGDAAFDGVLYGSLRVALESAKPREGVGRKMGTKHGRDALRKLARSLLRVRSVDDVDGKVTMDEVGLRIYLGIGGDAAFEGILYGSLRGGLEGAGPREGVGRKVGLVWSYRRVICRDMLRQLPGSLLRVRGIDDDGKFTMDEFGRRIYVGIGGDSAFDGVLYGGLRVVLESAMPRDGVGRKANGNS
ncbi:hypothetical protein HDU76_010702, partial [Blyttiomyces sp. JEL0837]